MVAPSTIKIATPEDFISIPPVRTIQGKKEMSTAEEETLARIEPVRGSFYLPGDPFCTVDPESVRVIHLDQNTHVPERGAAEDVGGVGGGELLVILMGSLGCTR